MPIQLGDLKLFSLQELSKKLNITTVTLRAYIRQGKLRARKLGTRWYFTEEALREYFDSPEREWGSNKEKPQRKELKGRLV